MLAILCLYFTNFGYWFCVYMNLGKLKTLNQEQSVEIICNFAPLFKQPLHTQQYDLFTKR